MTNHPRKLELSDFEKIGSTWNMSTRNMNRRRTLIGIQGNSLRPGFPRVVWERNKFSVVFTHLVRIDQR